MIIDQFIENWMGDVFTRSIIQEICVSLATSKKMVSFCVTSWSVAMWILAPRA